MRFTPRESKIINSLQDRNQSVKQLASDYNVGIKTIKSDIQNINSKIDSYNSEIMISEGSVKFISIYSAVHWKNIVKLNQTVEEEDLIFLKLLFKEGYIAMSDFAAELFISKSKLEKMLCSSPNLNTYVSKKRNVGIGVELGVEHKLSLAISILLPYVDDLNYLVTARALVQQIGDSEITFEQFNRYVDVFNLRITKFSNITDKECKILILLILIGNHLMSLEESQINKLIERYINNEDSNEKLRHVIEADVKQVLKENNILEISSSFLESVVNHIENVTQNHYSNTIEPAMELRLKSEYSYAYAIASELYKRLCITLSVDIEDYEKSYLALYVQSIINEAKDVQNLNVLIVCQYGMSVSHYIQTWIERNLSLSLNFQISSVLNYWNIQEATKKYDLIITTIDNLEGDSSNIIKVDTIPLDEQLTIVKQKIVNVHFQKQINSFFSSNTLKQIKIDCIDQMYNIIKQDFHHANSRFLEAMRRRTDEGLSNVNGVIIMHSDGTLITENRLLIYKLETPISYHQNEVKMIFVFAFSTEFIERFNGVIKQIYRIIYAEQYVNALYETTTDKQFMWIFKNQIKGKSLN